MHNVNVQPLEKQMKWLKTKPLSDHFSFKSLLSNIYQLIENSNYKTINCLTPCFELLLFWSCTVPVPSTLRGAHLIKSSCLLLLLKGRLGGNWEETDWEETEPGWQVLFLVITSRFKITSCHQCSFCNLFLLLTYDRTDASVW